MAVRNLGQGPFQVGDDVPRPETQDDPSQRPHIGVSTRVVTRSSVLRSVDLDHDPVAQAGEVGDVGADWMLSSELDTKAVVAKVAPEQALCITHGLTVDPGIPD